MKTLLKISLLSGILLFYASCSRDFVDVEKINPASLELSSKTSTSLVEDFESGTKTAYAVAAVTFGTGSWTLDDALVGTSTSDIKSGSQSIRARNTGKVTMGYDYTYGAATVTLKHAIYGSDGTSTWELYVSQNSGSTWTKVGSTQTTSSTSFATASFTVSLTGNVRFEIRKI